MVGEAIASVLNQTEQDVEIRVEFCAENWPTKLNDAMASLRGEWVMILCDDDLLHPTYIEECLKSAALADVIYTDRKVFRHEAPEDGFHFHMHGMDLLGPDPYQILIQPGAFLFGQSYPLTCLIRKTWWDEMGGHDPHMPHSDTELWYRLALAHARFVYVPQALFYYREHAEQMCRQIATMQYALAQFHRKHFLAFGVTFYPSRGYEVPGALIPLERRLGYQAAYLPSLTSTGYMATEKRTIPKSAQIAVQLQQKDAETKVNTLITLVLVELGLDPAEGWKMDGDYNAVREVPNAPVDLSIPAGQAIVAVETPPPPAGPLSLVPDTETGMEIRA